MRIGIDARTLPDGFGGIARMVSNLVTQLARIDQVNEYFLYSKLDFKLHIENPRWHKRILQKRRFRPLSGYFLTGVGGMIAEDEIDVFWEAHSILPFWLPPRISKVLSVYDFVWRLFPETMQFRNRLTLQLLAEGSLRKADRIISDSQNTLRDMERLFQVPASKGVVVYPGVLPDYWPRDARLAAGQIASKYGASQNYICTVGTLEPRKNFSTLVEAVRILRERGKCGLQLLIAGGSGWKNSEALLRESIARAGLGEAEVKLLGYVPEQDLPVLYSGARVFLYPSIYEGFGIPLIEAMACGVPVVASNDSSIPEVVQDAGILVSPKRPEEFAEAIAALEDNPELRARLVEKGFERARQFRYENEAKKLLGVFEELELS